jgi:hypothetical protein
MTDGPLSTFVKRLGSLFGGRKPARPMPATAQNTPQELGRRSITAATRSSTELSGREQGSKLPPSPKTASDLQDDQSTLRAVRTGSGSRHKTSREAVVAQPKKKRRKAKAGSGHYRSRQLHNRSTGQVLEWGPTIDRQPFGSVTIEQPSPVEPVPGSLPACAKLVERAFPRLLNASTSEGEADWANRIEAWEQQELKKRLRAGSADKQSDGRPRYVCLGIDFGTTSTKIVAGFPYSNDRFIPVPALPFASAEANPYLWISSLWLNIDGSFSLIPTEGGLPIHQIKAEFFTGKQKIIIEGLDREVDIDQIIAAFLTLQIRQARGYLVTDHKRIFSGYDFKWSFHFGCAVATMAENSIAHRYRRCCAAALQVSQTSSPVTLQNIAHALGSVSRDGKDDLNKLGGAIFPEIAAATAVYGNSLAFSPGLHVFIDVGGTTLDCCTFNLFDADDGEKRCSVLNADVRPFGVIVHDLWMKNGGREDIFRSAINAPLRGVIWDTKKNRNPHSPRWMEGLPIFLSGGGANSEIYREVVNSLDPWLKNYLRGSLGINLRSMELDEDKMPDETNEEQLQRLCVAIGLARPLEDIPETRLPTEIENIPPNQRRPWEERYVGPDQM